MTNVTEMDLDYEFWSQFLANSLKGEPRWFNPLYTFALMAIFVTSLIGNLLTCIVIYYDKTMHTATNYYLFNLAVSDLILTFGILLEVYECMTDTYHFGNIVCKLHFVFVVLLWNNSILIMTTLAIERYIVIWYPLMFQSKPVWRRVMKVIVVVWVIAIAETLPEFWSVSLIKTDKSSICYTVPTPYARMINGFLAIVTFVIPLAIMTFVYAMIAFKVNHSEKSNPDSMVFNHRENKKKVNKLIGKYSNWCPISLGIEVLFICGSRQITD